MSAVEVDCEGCETDSLARPYRVTGTDGSERRAVWCETCAELERGNWSGETAAVSPTREQALALDVLYDIGEVTEAEFADPSPEVLAAADASYADAHAPGAW